jgi:single stranded DNA-binding protein
MPSLNQSTILGNLTSNPKVHQTEDSKEFCTFDVALDQEHRSASAGIKKETVFVRVVAWDKLAASAKRLRKGNLVLVEGRLANYKMRNGDNPKIGTSLKAIRLQKFKTWREASGLVSLNQEGKDE